MTNCWYNFCKYTLIVLCVVFLAISIALIGLVTWLLTDKTFLISIAEEQDNYNAGLYILLGCGILMFIVAFLGCCGALRHHRCCLIAFSGIMLIIIGAQIAFGAWIYANRDRIDELLRSSVINTVKNEYGEIECRTQIMDAIQSGFECCGATGPADWAGSKYARKDSSLPLSITVSNDPNNMFKVPESCCKNMDSTDFTCDEARNMKVAGVVNSGIFGEGCTEKLMSALHNQIYYLIFVAILILSMEILNVMLALICCCEDCSSDRYKA